MTGNTILITGGSSGIGRGLAERFQQRGNKVIVTGRRSEALAEVLKANPGMESAELKMDDAEAVRAFGKEVLERYPDLNVVIQNAGIMRNENLFRQNMKDLEETITTNLLGPIRLNAAMLPVLKDRKDAVIMTVTSGIAYLPNAMAPSYAVSKAGIHAYTETLRYQLRDTGVQVIELVPPYVQTGLTGEVQRNDTRAMPLEDYLRETMELLEAQPDAKQILVERVLFQRNAERENRYDASFKQYNDTVWAARGAEIA